MTSVEINLSARCAGEVKLDGLDVSKIVQRLTVEATAGDGITVTLAFPVRENIHFAGEARVDLDPRTAELLQRLGWTPPDDSAVVLPLPSVEHDPVSPPPSG